MVLKSHVTTCAGRVAAVASSAGLGLQAAPATIAEAKNGKPTRTPMTAAVTHNGSSFGTCRIAVATNHTGEVTRQAISRECRRFRGCSRFRIQEAGTM